MQQQASSSACRALSNLVPLLSWPASFIPVNMRGQDRYATVLFNRHLQQASLQMTQLELDSVAPAREAAEGKSLMLLPPCSFSRVSFQLFLFLLNEPAAKKLQGRDLTA